MSLPALAQMVAGSLQMSTPSSTSAAEPHRRRRHRRLRRRLHRQAADVNRTSMAHPAVETAIVRVPWICFWSAAFSFEDICSPSIDVIGLQICFLQRNIEGYREIQASKMKGLSVGLGQITALGGLTWGDSNESPWDPGLTNCVRCAKSGFCTSQPKHSGGACEPNKRGPPCGGDSDCEGVLDFKSVTGLDESWIVRNLRWRIRWCHRTDCIFFWVIALLHWCSRF